MQATNLCHISQGIHLYMMYAQGRSIIEDDVEAYKWLSLAGMNGYDVSSIMDILRDRMTAEQIPEAKKKWRRNQGLVISFTPHTKGIVLFRPDSSTACPNFRRWIVLIRITPEIVDTLCG